MEVPGNFFKRNRLADPSLFFLPERQMSPILCPHWQKPPLRWPNGKMERTPTTWLRYVSAMDHLPRSVFYGRKINSFAKNTVSKALCNLQSNAFLTDPTLSVHALQLMNGFSPAIEHTSTALTSQQLTTGLPHSNTHLALPSSDLQQSKLSYLGCRMKLI